MPPQQLVMNQHPEPQTPSILRPGQPDPSAGILAHRDKQGKEEAGGPEEVAPEGSSESS